MTAPSAAIVEVDANTTTSELKEALFDLDAALFPDDIVVKKSERGMQANVMRAMVLNGTKMGCYDQIKQMLKKDMNFQPGLALEFCSAFGAGFFMTCTVAPFDMVRTKLMNQPHNAKMYHGFVDCFVKIVKSGGPQALYVGAIPIWSRFAPTTCIQLMIFSQIKPFFGISK